MQWWTPNLEGENWGQTSRQAKDSTVSSMIQPVWVYVHFYSSPKWQAFKWCPHKHTSVNRRCPPTYVHPHIQIHAGTHCIADCNWQMSHFRQPSESRWGSFYSCHTCFLMPLHPSQNSCDHLKSNERRDERATSHRLSESPTPPCNLDLSSFSILTHVNSLLPVFLLSFSFFPTCLFYPSFHLRHIIDATLQTVMTGFLYLA